MKEDSICAIDSTNLIKQSQPNNITYIYIYIYYFTANHFNQFSFWLSLINDNDLWFLRSKISIICRNA